MLERENLAQIVPSLVSQGFLQFLLDSKTRAMRTDNRTGRQKLLFSGARLCMSISGHGFHPSSSTLLASGVTMVNNHSTPQFPYYKMDYCEKLV